MVQPKVHQPSMKVFTVGLDEKERAKQNEEKGEMTKIPIDSNTTTPAPSPQPPLPPRENKKKFKGCGIFSWLVAAFLVIILCITISEISYNRSRDEAFFRLKWAELRQRMVGYELLSRIQNNQAVDPIQPPPVVDERMAFSNRKIESLEDAAIEEQKHQVDQKTNKEIEEQKVQPMPDNSQEEDPRFGFLRAILDKIRSQAENSDGPMRIHVIQVKPLVNNQEPKMSQQAWEDGFGEVAMPKQTFGQFGQQNDMQDEGFQQPWNNRPFESREDFFDQQPPRFLFNDAPFPQPEFQRPPFSPMNAAPFPFNPWANRFPMNGQFDYQNRQDMPAPFPFQQQQQPNFFNQMNHMPVQQAPMAQPETQQRPWYLPQQETNQWQNTWQPQNTQNNEWNNKDALPFNPHPAAAVPQHPMQWVDGSAQVKEEENQGIDNFEREESFNIPMDVIHDSEPVEIQKAGKKQEFLPNQWQHSQPEEAIQEPAADVPVEVPSKPEQATSSEEEPERHQFLPVRPTNVHDAVEEPSADGIPDMKNSPFFQIDDPNSFKQ